MFIFKAYSLIEIIFVLSLTTFLVIGSVGAVRTYRSFFELEKVTNDYISELLYIQSSAGSGKNSMVGIESSTYNVDIGNSLDYTICNSENICVDMPKKFLKRDMLSKINVESSCSKIVFSELSNSTQIYKSTNLVDKCCVTLSLQNDKRIVFIDPLTKQIKIIDPEDESQLCTP